ncbi:CYTH domain-containing protein [Candidatus Saccharibacteria bacterium]|nr:CYTH domain-containing protein [Candidatus Saccharibacteria bacterium]
MKTEYEAKFIRINHDEIRQKLKDIGATLHHPMRLMRRAIIENEELKKKDAFLRVRDEGDKITLTYKQFSNLSVDGAKEHEIIVNDFNETVSLFAASGLPHRSIQESKRETWTYDHAEVVLDEWPWLDPYIEIEADSEEAVKKLASELGFDWNDAVFGDVMAAYRAQYPHLSEKDTVGNLPIVRFGDPLPDLLKDKV